MGVGTKVILFMKLLNIWIAKYDYIVVGRLGRDIAISNLKNN